MVAFSQLTGQEQSRVRRQFNRSVERQQEQIEADPRQAWASYLPADEAAPLLEHYSGDEGLERALREREWDRAERREAAAVERTIASINDLDYGY